MGDLHQVVSIEASGSTLGADTRASRDGVLGVVAFAGRIQATVVVERPAAVHALGHGIWEQHLFAVGEAQAPCGHQVAVLRPGRHSSFRAVAMISTRDRAGERQWENDGEGQDRLEGVLHNMSKARWREPAPYERAVEMNRLHRWRHSPG